MPNLIEVHMNNKNLYKKFDNNSYKKKSFKNQTDIFQKQQTNLTKLTSQSIKLDSLSKPIIFENNINSKNLIKSNLELSFENKFKDVSRSYISPFGKPITRAPDESSVHCKSKECFE